MALAESIITELKKKDIVQLERRGYYYVDKDTSESDIMHLHFIPDGKAKAVSVVSSKVDAKKLSKGDNADDEKKKKKEKKKENKEKKPKENTGEKKEDNSASPATETKKEENTVEK